MYTEVSENFLPPTSGLVVEEEISTEIWAPFYQSTLDSKHQCKWNIS
jgi:hypothetical protein